MERVAATDDGVEAFCRVWENPKPHRFTDAEPATKVGVPGPIGPGIRAMGIMSRLLTDWAGPGAVKDLDVVFRQPVPHHNPLQLPPQSQIPDKKTGRT